MACYRLYRLAEPGGKVAGFEEIGAEDDGGAVARDKAFAGQQALELWCGKRKVKTFPPSGE